MALLGNAASTICPCLEIGTARHPARHTNAWARRQSTTDAGTGEALPSSSTVQPYRIRVSLATFVVGLSETHTLAEQVAALFAALGDISEAVALAESLVASQAFSGDVSETVTIAEALASLEGAVVAVSETVSIAESLAAIAARIADLSESLSLSESVGAVEANVVAIPDSVALVEAMEAVAANLAALGDSVALAEQLAGAFAATDDVSEALALADALDSILAAAADLGDAVDLAEHLVGGSTDYDEQLAEALSIAESITAVVHATVTSALVAIIEHTTGSLSPVAGGDGGGALVPSSITTVSSELKT